MVSFYLIDFNHMTNNFFLFPRSYGRPVKQVRLHAKFVPFDMHNLPRSFNDVKLMKDPVLHIYWIDYVSVTNSLKLLMLLLAPTSLGLRWVVKYIC